MIAACQFKAFFQNVFNLFHVNVILLPYVLQHKNTAFSWNLYFKTRKKAITLSLFDLNQFSQSVMKMVEAGDGFIEETERFCCFVGMIFTAHNSGSYNP